MIYQNTAITVITCTLVDIKIKRQKMDSQKRSFNHIYDHKPNKTIQWHAQRDQGAKPIEPHSIFGNAIHTRYHNFDISMRIEKHLPKKCWEPYSTHLF